MKPIFPSYTLKTLPQTCHSQNLKSGRPRAKKREIPRNEHSHELGVLEWRHLQETWMSHACAQSPGVSRPVKLKAPFKKNISFRCSFRMLCNIWCDICLFWDLGKKVRDYCCENKEKNEAGLKTQKAGDFCQNGEKAEQGLKKRRSPY